jgi:hypothetical protein
LASASISNDHEINIIDVKDKKITHSVKGGSEVIFGTVWKSEFILVSCGDKHFKLWNFEKKIVD